MSRKGLLLVCKGAAGVVLLAVILYNADIGEVATLLMSSNFGLVFLACAFLSLALAVNAIRWNAVTDHLQPAIGMGNAVIGNFEGMFFNQVLPTTIGGDAVRGLRAYDAGMQPARAAASVIIDRAFGLLFVAATLAAAFVIGGSAVLQSTVFYTVAILSAVVVLGAGAAVLIGVWRRAETVPAFFRPAATLVQFFSEIVRSGRRMGLVSGVLVIANALTIGAFIACVHAIGIDVGWWDAAIILQGMLFISIVPVSIGGWGVREGAAVLLFSSLDIGTTQATAASVLFGLVLTAVGLIGAGVWLANGYNRVETAGSLANIKSGLRQLIGKTRP